MMIIIKSNPSKENVEYITCHKKSSLFFMRVSLGFFVGSILDFHKEKLTQTQLFRAIYNTTLS